MRKLLCFWFLIYSFFGNSQGVEIPPGRNQEPSNPAYVNVTTENGILYGNNGTEFFLDSRKFLSYDELRLNRATARAYYEVWLENRIEFWQADLVDKTTPDNNSTTLLGINNVRYKRFFSSLSNPLATEFKGTWNAATNQPALTTIPTGNGSYYLVSQAGTQSITGVPENYETGDQVLSNGTGWFRIRSNLSDGSVSEGKIAARAVSPAKTTFIALKPGKNLFDKGAAKDSLYMNKSGVLVNTNPGYSLSDFIEVEPGVSYFGKGADSRGMRFTTFFNAAKTVITGGSDEFTTSVVPTGTTKYVRVSILSTDKNTFQFEKGTAQTKYEEFVISQVLTGVQVDSTSIGPASVTTNRIADRAITPVKLVSRSITAGQIAPRAITTSEVNFVQESKNLFNKRTKEVGVFLNENGVKNANSIYTLSDYIPVVPGQTYFGKGAGTTGMRFISHFTSATESGFVKGGATTPTNTLTPPAGINYVRVTIATPDTASFQFEVGTIQTPYVEYGGVLKGVKVDSTAISDASVTNSKLALRAVTTNRIVDKSITPVKTSFIIRRQSKNLYDKASSLDGQYVNETGRPQIDARFTLSQFIEVTPGQTYFGKSNTGGSGMRFTSYYTETGTWVSGGPTNYATTFTPPANVKFVRISILVGEKNTFQLEAGSVQTPYVDYSVTETLAGVKVDSTAFSPGSVTNSILADRSVSASKVDFITTQVGKNLFNKKTKKVGVFINENGVEQANATYTVSDFIPVAPSQAYFGRGNATTGMRFVGFYTDKTDGSFVKGAGPTTATTTFTTPASGINYVRLSILTSDTASFQLEKGTARTTYEDYKESYVLKNIAADGISQGVKEQIVTDVKTSLATEKPLTTDFALATKIYWPVGRQIEIYTENCLKLYEKWRGYFDFTSNISGSKQTGRAFKATPGAAGLYSVTTTAYDNNYELAYTLSSQIQAVPLTNTAPVKIMNCGDSYTLRSSFTNRLNATVAQGVTYLGIRRTTMTTPAGQNAEGRGGYLMATYHTLSKNTTQFSPFMQPTGNSYKYYGVTGFWKIVHGAGGYDWDYYENVKGMFNASTGYLINPNVDDIQYDNALSKFVRWDGSSWVDIAESALNFTFNFAKYRQAWNIASPDIFHCMLGTNDFSFPATFDATYSTFKARYETMIASIKADSPNCKIIVAIPVSSGRQGVDGIATTERRKRVFWMLAKAINTDFSGREAQGIYIADYHSTVDRTYGYDRTFEKPFFNYTGTETEPYLNDSVHISQPGFNQEGEQYMALIQLLRP